MVNSLLNPSNTDINLLQDNSFDLQSNCVCADSVLRGFFDQAGHTNMILLAVAFN